MCNLTLEETMYRMMELSGSKRDKAILLLLWSSGMQPRFIRGLKVNQLLSACNHLFKEGKEKTISNLISNSISSSPIPCFDIGTASKPRVTCCTPEALELILFHLYWSYQHDRLGEYVFSNQDGEKLTNNYVSDLILKLRNEISYYGDFNIPDINARIIRERFNAIIDNQLRGPCPELAIRLMKGDSTKKTREFYNDVLNNKKILTEHYTTVIGELSLSNFANKRKTYDMMEYTVNKM